MTELAVAKTTLGMAAVPAVTLAAIDPATQISILQVVSLFITTAGTVIAGWIALKHAALKTKVDQLEKNTNGLKEALIESTAKENLAAGKLEGVAEEKATQAVIDKATAVGVAQEKVAEQLRPDK